MATNEQAASMAEPTVSESQLSASSTEKSTTHHHPRHTEKKRKNRSGQLILNGILGLAIVGGLVWAVRLFQHYDDNQMTNDAQIEEFITPINSRIGGYIKTIHFTEHQPVHKGDTLVVIDDRELRIQLEQAEAGYLDALASRSVTNSSINTVRNNTVVTEANIAELKARLWSAEQNYKRYQNLLADESVSQQQFEQVKAEYDALQAKYQALQSQKQSTQLQTTEVSQRLGVHAATIKRAQATLDMARLNLSYTVIRAPYDGVVGRRTIQDGQLISPGQALVSIVRSDQKWVVANYKETQTTRLRIGQSVHIKVDALNDITLNGTITAISEATGSKYSLVPTDNSAGNFVKVQQRIPVRIDFTAANKPDDLARLRAGMNVEVAVN